MHLQNNPRFTESYPTSQSACLERCHDTHSDRVYTGGLEASSAPVLGESKTCLQKPLWGRTVKKNRHFLAMLFSEIFWNIWGFGFGKKAHPADTSYKRRSRKSSLREQRGRPFLMKFVYASTSKLNAFPSLERPRLRAKIIPSPFWSQGLCINWAFLFKGP